VSEDESGEPKPKRGRKPKAATVEIDVEATVAEDVAAGAEDRQPQKRRGRPPKNKGRDHLRIVK
jgi:hypothetical protein